MLFATGRHRFLGIVFKSQTSPGMLIEPPSAERRRPGALSSKEAPVAMMAFSLLFAAMAVIVAGFLLSILKINHGTFVYTLDDPYIHLALSDQIRHGNYGIYPGVHAAPASSILFPFLLTLAAGTGLHPY